MNNVITVASHFRTHNLGHENRALKQISNYTEFLLKSSVNY